MNKIPKLLILAVIVAIFLRFWHLSTIPSPPDGDGVAFGYYGWSLLHFGTDEYGKVLPTNFVSIGDYKYPGLGYLNIIPAAIFGLSNITTRFWSASSGVILVVLIYFLANFIFSNKKVSLFAAFAAALLPWSIMMSRQGYETLTSTTLTTAGIVCFLYLTRSKNKKHKYILLSASLILFIISFFAYAASRFFIPAFLLGMLIFSLTKNSFLKNYKKILLIFSIIFISLILISLTSSANWGRAKEDMGSGITAIENNRLQELYIGAGTSFIRLPARLTWLFHNKYRIELFDFIGRYTDHFSVSYLFINGESIGQRIPDMGVLLLIDLILLPFGLIALLKSESKIAIKIIFLWLILAPIPSALTSGEAKMIRATLLIVPFAVLSGLGFNYLADLQKKGKILITALLLFGVLASSLYSLNQIFVQKPLDKPWTKQTVNQELTESILKLKGNYKAVATGDDDYIFFLFYGKITPPDFLKRSDIEPLSQAKWARVDRLDNIYFKMPYLCPKGGKLNVLYVCAGGDVPQNSKIIQTFYYPDGFPAYTLIEFYPESQMSLSGKLPILPDKFHYMVDVESKYPDGIIPSNNSALW